MSEMPPKKADLIQPTPPPYLVKRDNQITNGRIPRSLLVCKLANSYVFELNTKGSDRNNETHFTY